MLTDEQIIDIMYDHVTGFSSCVQFKNDAAVIAFARDLLEQATFSSAPAEESEDLVERFVEDADGFLGSTQAASDLL